MGSRLYFDAVQVEMLDTDIFNLLAPEFYI